MSEPASVTLYGKADCHLCDEAEALLRPLSAQRRLAYRKVDIQSSPELFDRFRYRIPVIELDGGSTLDWPVTAARAGADLLLFTSPKDAQVAIKALLPLASAGELDAHVTRVLRFRARYALR